MSFRLSGGNMKFLLIVIVGMLILPMVSATLEDDLYGGSLYDGDTIDNWGSTSLTFEVRSCAVSDCDGVSWVGNYTNSSFSNLSSVSDNRYFQYKAIFESDLAGYSPLLSNVSVGYEILNEAPGIEYIRISNSEPIVTNDVIDANFKVNDSDGDVLNISVTWFKSSDNITWSAHTSDDESWNDQSNATYFDTQYNTGSSGDLESSDTNAWEYWKVELTVTDGQVTTSENSSSFLITNNPPSVSVNSSGTSYADPADKGDSITFTLTGTDSEDDLVKLKVCDSNTSSWDSCTALCSDLTGVTFDSVTSNDISCSYNTVEDSRNHTGYAILYDGGNETSPVAIDYFVNQYVVLENFSMQDTSGNTDYYFGEYIDFFRIDWSDTFDSDVDIYLTVSDPDGVVKVDNQVLSNVSGSTKGYESNLFLDAVGTWSVNMSVTDSDGAITTYNSDFVVNKVSVGSTGRLYAYDFESFPDYSTINESIETYGYYVVELRIDSSSNWTDVSNTLQTMKNNSQVAVLTLEDDLSDVSGTLSFIDSYYSDLIGADHLNALRMLKIYIPDGVTENSANSESINNISKKIFQEVSNKLPIYLRNYNETDLNSNYVTVDTYKYINNGTVSSYLDEEISTLRSSSSRSRFYANLSDTLKSKVASYQTDVLNKFRAAINTSSTYSESNIAELTNGDIVIVNSGGSSSTYKVNLTSEVTGFDVYDLSSKNIIETNNDGMINITVPGETAKVVYFTNLTKVKLEDDGDIYLYGQESGTGTTTTDLSTASGNAFLFASSSANPDDGRIILTDPDYVNPDFYVWYGTNNYEAISNWDRYEIVILGDYSNSTWVSEIANSTSMYGYTSVNTYGNNNYPDGCTSGVDCSSWNRSLWISDLKDDIDVWTNMDDDVNIFIDGLDIGEVNDVDGLFGDALVELSDYVKISKQRELVLNTYTNYEDFANLGDYTMRESACARWDGSVNSPTYSYEDIDLELQRANFHKTHGIPVLAQSFGSITDDEKAYYCYMQNSVLYGDLMKYSYNQPTFEYTNAADKFQWNYFKFPELGSALEDDYVQVGDDSFTRRFEKGIVTVNTSDHSVDFVETNTIDQIEFCSYYYDNDDGSNDEGYMHFVINDNQSRYFNVEDTDLTAFSKTWKCQNISVDYYEPSGFYEIEFYYLDSDGEYLNNNGLYMYYDVQPGSDRLSFWESTLNDHPSNDETDYWYFNTGTNWAVNFSVHRTATENSIDDLSSVISRSTSGTEKVNVTLNSGSNDFDLEIYDQQQFVNKSVFNGIYVGETLLNVSQTNCDTSSPTYSETMIGGETWKACKYNSTGDGYYVKVVLPHLSTMSYLIDANNPPVIDTQSINLVNFSSSNQSWTFTFNGTDADGNNITTCRVSVEGEDYTGSAVNNSCIITVSRNLNSSSQVAEISLDDSYSSSSTNGVNYTLASILYDEISSSPTVGNLTTQHFRKYWNITQNNGVFNNISWDYDGLSSRSINISNGTTRNYLDYSTNLISVSEYDFVPDGSNEYVVDQGETIFRYFNVTGNLSTGEGIPSFNVSLDMPQYTSGTQSMSYNCGSYDSYTNFSSGSNMIALISDVNDSVFECYQYSYNGKVVYSDATLESSQDGDVRTYFFNNSDDNGYGSKINFLFDELKNTSIGLAYNIDYGDLPNWDSRTGSTKDVFRYTAPDTYAEETITTDFTYTDNEASELVIFDWVSTNAPFDNLFVNLSYSAIVATYQCNDGLDNDGDGLIDYPDDPGCTGLTDDSENTDASSDDGGSSGGGGGSSGGSVDLGDTDEDGDAEALCKISVDPEIVRFSSNGIKKITVFNGGTSSYEPSFSVVGDIKNYLSITNTVTVLPGKGSEFGIKYDALNFTEGEATVKLIDSECGSLEIYVKADSLPAPINIIETLFDNDISQLIKEPVFSPEQGDLRDSTPYFTIGIIMILSMLVFSLILYQPIKKSLKQESYGKTAAWIVFLLIFSFILMIVIVTIMRMV